MRLVLRHLPRSLPALAVRYLLAIVVVIGLSDALPTEAATPSVARAAEIENLAVLDEIGADRAAAQEQAGNGPPDLPDLWLAAAAANPLSLQTAKPDQHRRCGAVCPAPTLLASARAPPLA